MPNAHWFLTLADAVERLEAWRRYYNEERPHGAIGNKVPIMLTKSGGATSRVVQRWGVDQRHQPVTMNEAIKSASGWSNVGDRITGAADRKPRRL